MLIVHKESGQVTSESDFIEDVKQKYGEDVSSITYAVLDKFNCAIVQHTDKPISSDRYKEYVEKGLEEKDGVWYTTYELWPVFSDFTTSDGVLISKEVQEADFKSFKDSQKATEVRILRNKLLSESDWVIARAYELQESVPANLATYRQRLRDITEQPGFPWEVVWPAL